MARKFKDSQVVVWKKNGERGVIFGMHKGIYVVAFKDVTLAGEKPGGYVEGGWAVMGLRASELELYEGVL